MRRQGLEACSVVGLALLSTPIFWLTDADVWVARQFYDAENLFDHWPQQHAVLWQLLYDYAFGFVLVLAALLLLVVLVSVRLKALQPLRRPSLYLFWVIVLGPGLVVNLVFKDHWGRPRPMHIQAFGGDYAYVPPLQMADTADKSFVCGHCSVGYAFFGLYFLAPHGKTWYLVLTLVLAGLLAWARLAAGGHFLSDILWSGFLVFAVAWCLYYGWYRPSAHRNSASPPDR